MKHHVALPALAVTVFTLPQLLSDRDAALANATVPNLIGTWTGKGEAVVVATCFMMDRVKQ